MQKSLLIIVAGMMLTVSSIMATEKVPDTSFNPFEEMQKMQREMDRIFDNFHQKMMKDDSFSKFTTSFPTSPAVDLKDMGDNYLLKADIPGSDKNEIKITTKNGMLKIEAKTSKTKEEKKKDFLKQERFVGTYMRMITLPDDADTEKLKSEYVNGVLEVTIPKKR